MPLNPRSLHFTAAITDPDCELHHNVALAINTFATRARTKQPAIIRPRLIYTSTDLIFDGAKLYGSRFSCSPKLLRKTKYLGELEISFAATTSS
jgi:dTDP-4-dehydrorhamnose reductase